MPSGGARGKAGRMPDPASESFQQRSGGLFALPEDSFKDEDRRTRRRTTCAGTRTPPV